LKKWATVLKAEEALAELRVSLLGQQAKELQLLTKEVMTL
jgi:hypothetical protein